MSNTEQHAGVAAKVLVVGAGGLGVPIMWALAEAGVRRITVIDPDRVELSNLHRQIAYREADIGRFKAERVAGFFTKRYPGIEIQGEVGAFSGDLGLLSAHDLVLDGTDRFETKLMIQDACLAARAAYVFGAVVGLEGQVMGVLPGRSACVRCLFDDAPPPGAAATCDEAGIIGPIAGVVASRQVEVGLSLLGGSPLIDQLWSYDGGRDRARTIPLARAPDCQGCGERQRLRAGVPSLPLLVDATADRELDLTGETCPRTFQLARRVLEPMAPGQRLWVTLTSDEAVRNVPASLTAAGDRVLGWTAVPGGGRRILIERGPA